MILLNNRPLMVFLGLLFCFSFTKSKAQKVETYQGPYILDNYIGNASFQFRIVEGDTILDGHFFFEQEAVGASSKEANTSFSASGKFSKNLPVGRWEFTYAKVKASKTTQLVDYQYVSAVDGKVDKTQGSFFKGKASGRWTFKQFQIENSKISDTLFQSEINYKEGLPQLSSRFMGVSSSLLCRALRDGSAHDQWSLFSQDAFEAKEQWYFNEGLLGKLEVNTEEKKEEFEVFTDLAEEERLITLDQDYLGLLLLKNPSLTSLGISRKGIGKLLNENAEMIGRIQNAFNGIGLESPIEFFKVKVPVFPFTNEDKVILQQIVSLVSESEGISDAIVSNAQLNIAKLTDPEIAYYFDITKSIQKKHLPPFSRLKAISLAEIFEYLPKEQLIARVFPNGLPTENMTTGTFNDGNALYKLSDIAFPNSSERSLQSILAYAKYYNRTLLELGDRLNVKASTASRETKIVSEEEFLMFKEQDFQAYILRAKEVSSEEIKATLDAISERAQKELTMYSAMEDSEEKLSRAISLEDCYENLKELAKKVEELPRIKKAVEEEYIDQVWNPFTATLMDESIKKRITRAYGDVIIPYTLKEISQKVSCENASKFTKEIDSQYDRLIELRDINTKKMERKLKRKTDTKEVLSILGIQLLSS